MQGPIDSEHEFQAADFPISDSLFRTFKEFVAKDQKFRQFAPALDHNRAFVDLHLRFNIVTAAYGRTNADRVFVMTDDPQLMRAIDALPRARSLAQSARQQKNQP